MQTRIAVIVGSLRKESFNRKMAMNIIDLAPQALKIELVEIGQLNSWPWNQRHKLLH